MPDLKFLEVFFAYHFQRRNSVSPTDGAAQTGGSTPCGDLGFFPNSRGNKAAAHLRPT